jgi:hypothetical protein
MQLFSINGVAKEAPVAEDSNFRDLLAHVHEHLLGPESLIASIKVNGVEINEGEEQELAPVALADLDSVEITLAHPREMAEETLQTLMNFAERLARLCPEAAEALEASPPDHASYDRLLDGIQTFAESIAAVKSILRIGILTPVNVLEVDLVSTMKDLLDANQKGDAAYRDLILREHLPGNLSDWVREGIPAMIKSRDS